VYFGYPRAHEDDAERAVRAGLQAIDAVGRLDIRSVTLRARVGIGTGLVVVGDLIGEGSAQEQSVVGETQISPPGCKPWPSRAGWLAIFSSAVTSAPSN
jgi:class 3 adenylate cyclase